MNSEVLTTEDSFRYTFFAAILYSMDIDPHEVILEYPHPILHNRLVDTYIPSILDRAGLVVEFKYDKYSGKYNLPRPLKAGKLINDLYRLQSFQIDLKAKRWFVYLTDSEMATYLSKKTNGLDSFFNLGKGNSLVIDKNIINSRSDTFIKNIPHINDEIFSITCLLSNEMPNKHKLKIYQLN